MPVPGAPKSATCSSTPITLPDEFDRTWRVTTIDYENHTGYERVVLNLSRKGKNRTNTPTQAVATRMRASDVAKSVPGVTKPSRGQVAVAIELDGMTDAPGLYRYHPRGVDLVKEVSVARGGGGWNVVITSPQHTCYEMRIPKWAHNATGKEQGAKIFIDFKTK